jgi:SulP family sulfate permease
MPHVPPLSIAKVREVLPAAFSFALLGSIESLLSAVVADSMTGRRHRSNAELVAQGIANIGSSLFGGICVTGTIARTATNVRAGSRSPVSGIIHAAALLLLMMIAAPLASYIPLAALAAVLAVVCWSMAEKHEFWILLRASRADAIVVLATFLLVIFKDLTTGIVVGFCLASLVFLYRMAQMVQVDRPLIEDDLPDNMGTSYPRYDSSTSTDPNVVVYRISGAFFFGAAAGVAAALERTGEHPRAYVIDFSAVSILDSTAAATIAGIVHRAHRHGVKFFMAGAGDGIRGTLLAHGVSAPAVAYYPALTDALADARKAAPQA